MASLSSGSSDEEEASYTTTDVLLGYASKTPTDDPFSQLGGYPAWPDIVSPPSALLAKCQVCSRMMLLLLQLNGDLPERFPGHERRLYIFACRSKTCKKKEGSIRAVRGARLLKTASPSLEGKLNGTPQPYESTPSQSRPMLGDSIFGSKPPSTSSSNANPFSTSASPNPSPFATDSSSQPLLDLASKPAQRPNSSMVNNPATDSSSTLSMTFAQKARISSAPRPLSSTLPTKPASYEPWPEQSQLPPPYPSYQLDADYEALDNTSSADPNPLHNVDIEEDSASGGGRGRDEAFESTLDKTFQKFATRLSHNPLQVLRYEFGGSPLLYRKTDGVGKLFASSTATIGNSMPRCNNCGAKRVFEVQLVPQAIAELEAEEMSLEGMEWGTIIVGVCGDDCGERKANVGAWGWMEEWVGVQWEETGGGVGVGVGGRR